MRLGRINRTSAYLIVISSLCCMILVFIPNVDVLPARRSFLGNSRRSNVGPDHGFSGFERRRDEEAFKITSNDGENGGVIFLKLKEGSLKVRDSLKAQQNEPQQLEPTNRLDKFFDSLKTTKKSWKSEEVDSLSDKNEFSMNAEQRDSAKPRLGDSSSLETITLKAIQEDSEEMQSSNDQTQGTKLGANTLNEKRRESLNLPETITNEDLRSVKGTAATPSVNRNEKLTHDQDLNQRTANISAENKALNSASQRYLTSRSIMLAVNSTASPVY